MWYNNKKLKVLIIFLMFARGKEKGVTLIEIIISVFIIALFSTIFISNFPRILRQFALSRGSYKLTQDLRRVIDLALSGVDVKVKVNSNNEFSIQPKGYGVYITLSNPSKYYIYADRGENPNFRYDGDDIFLFCQDEQVLENPEIDCILEAVDLKAENLDLYIREIVDEKGKNLNSISINFAPPNPTIDIIDKEGNSHSALEIILALSSIEGLERKILINTAGLIKIGN